MRLERHGSRPTVEKGTAWETIRSIVDDVFNQRLDRAATTPVLVAFSGGGDSLALLLAAKEWADAARRPLRVATVDHRLQPAGARWAKQCAERCAALGVPHATLVWEGEKPQTGVSAAARRARHGLIADHARALGSAVVLMGHTADDRLEARAMRAAGANVSDPRVWSPSPIWPQGRGVFILRPLLDVRRCDIRAALAARGETWIDDPANGDMTQTRARARHQIAACAGDQLVPDLGRERPSPLFGDVVEGPAGDLTIDRAALTAVGRDDARRFVAAALLCAAGTSRPPRGDRLDRLMDQIRGSHGFVRTLAGARIEGDAGAVTIMRDAGEFARRAARDTPLGPGRPSVFDGRFEITVESPDLRIGALRGRAASLAKSERARMKTVPARARAATPVLVAPDGAATSVLFGNSVRFSLKRLIMPRLAGALNEANCESVI